MDKQKILINRVTKTLFNKSGKICSPRLGLEKYSDLIKEVSDETNFLPPKSSFQQRWWHLLHGNIRPTCYCGSLTSWTSGNKGYNRYCTQKCASTSPEASERTKQQFQGMKQPQDQVIRARQTRIKNGYYRDRKTTITKLSTTKLGRRNPNYKKTPWNKGLFGANNPIFGKKFPGRGKSGNTNTQYGKPPSPQAGIGVKGWYKKQHFRSSLEMFYLIYWDTTNTQIISAETNEFRVKYKTHDNKQKTYSPDFYLPASNLLVEIKPEKLHKNYIIQQKLEVLQEYHKDKDCLITGFRNIAPFITSLIYTKKIEAFVQTQTLQFCDKQFEKLQRNYADILRACERN